MEHAGLLADLEQQLTQAAELFISGSIPEALYASTLRGVLATLPAPPAPRHILVLKALKTWKDMELIPLSKLGWGGRCQSFLGFPENALSEFLNVTVS